MFWYERDVAIDGEIVEYRAGEFLARPIAVRDGCGNLLGLLTSEVCGAGVEQCSNRAGRGEEFDLPKQRQLGNGGSSAETLERRIEGNVDSLRGFGTDVLHRDEQHPVIEEEVDDDVRPQFHDCFLLYSRQRQLQPECD